MHQEGKVGSNVDTTELHLKKQRYSTKYYFFLWLLLSLVALQFSSVKLSQGHRKIVRSATEINCAYDIKPILSISFICFKSFKNLPGFFLCSSKQGKVCCCRTKFVRIK